MMRRKNTREVNSLPGSYRAARPKIEARFEHFEDVFERMSCNLRERYERLEEKEEQVINQLMQELFRTLWLVSCGNTAEESIDVAIGYYKFVRDNWNAIHDMPSFDEVPVDLKDNITAVFQSLITEFDCLLSHAGVSVHEVEPGTTLNRSRHQVIERLATDDPSQLNTVCRCRQPELRWPCGNIERRQAAEVSAYTELSSVARKKRSRKAG